jgi:hypothetical protein
MLDEHAAAVLAILNAVDDDPPLAVLDGLNTDTATRKSVPPPYVLVYFDRLGRDVSFAGRTHGFAMSITCHQVGGSPRAARMVADRVDEALLDVTPTVAGRKCQKIRWDSDGGTVRDETVPGKPVLDQITTYVLRSVPA